MTDLNTANLQETINNVFQTPLNKNSKRTSILLWTNSNPKLPNSFILKDKDDQRYLGLVRTDRKGQTYWCFRKISKSGKQSENNKNYANNANPSKE